MLLSNGNDNDWHLNICRFFDYLWRSFMGLPLLTRRAFFRDVSALSVASLVAGAPRSGLGQQTIGAPCGAAYVDNVDKTALHKLEAVRIENVAIDDDFWAPKFRVWQK